VNIMLSCGEASGDLYAGALLAELRRREPSSVVSGMGGQRFAEAGGRVVADFHSLTVTGLIEMIAVLPRSYATLRRLVADARRTRPDVFVAIDFPDFNFRLMTALRRLGIPIVYYVSPQLWAWRPQRMQTMQRCVDKVLVLFPFERELYERAGVPVEFVGHPLVDLARPAATRAEFLGERGLDPDAPTVALLPGSRRNEVRRLAPVIVEALPAIRAAVPNVQFVVACAPTLAEGQFALFTGGASGVRPVLVRDRTDDVLAASDVVVTASGTATVQTALHGKPMVVIYKLSSLSYAIGKPLVSVSLYAMPNLVAGRQIVPELIQDGCTPDRIARQTIELLTNGRRRGEMQEALQDVARRLGSPGASARAAEAVLGIARQREIRSGVV
jgi:lipid-A-disaccharide synthase